MNDIANDYLFIQRDALYKHLIEVHNFHLGHPKNPHILHEAVWSLPEQDMVVYQKEGDSFTYRGRPKEIWENPSLFRINGGTKNVLAHFVKIPYHKREDEKTKEKIRILCNGRL